MWPAIIGAAVGALGNYLSRGSGGDRSGAIKDLQPGNILGTRGILFPELAGLMDEKTGLLNALLSQVNRNYGNATQSFDDILARGGMLGAGLQGGGHGALQLARGSQMNQARTTAEQMIWNILFNATNTASNVNQNSAAMRAGTPPPQPSPLLGALSGLGTGLQFGAWDTAHPVMTQNAANMWANSPYANINPTSLFPGG